MKIPFGAEEPRTAVLLFEIILDIFNVWSAKVTVSVINGPVIQ
jgi:hypothetical protein